MKPCYAKLYAAYALKSIGMTGDEVKDALKILSPLLKQMDNDKARKCYLDLLSGD
jgi:hypothetical protein